MKKNRVLRKESYYKDCSVSHCGWAQHSNLKEGGPKYFHFVLSPLVTILNEGRYSYYSSNCLDQIIGNSPKYAAIKVLE